MTPDHPTRVLPVTERPVLAPQARSSHPWGADGSGADRTDADDAPAAPARTAHPHLVPTRLRPAALLVALLGALATVAVWRFFVDTHLGQVVEEIAFDGAVVGRNQLWTLAEPLLDVVSVGFVVLGMTVAMGIALARRRWALAVQVVLVVVGSNLTTQLLKHVVFDRADLGNAGSWGNSLPSGHTTVAASVSVALLLAVPRAARPVVVLFGATYTAATGVSTLVGQWHRPSDVVAALCVVLVWGALACAVTSWSSLDPAVGPERERAAAARGAGVAGVTTLLLLVVLVGGLAAGWALRRTAAVVESGARVGDRVELVAYVGGASGVVAVTALVFVLLLVLRQAVARPALAGRV